MNSWKIILATVVIFGAGVLTGGLLVNYVNHAQPASPPPPASEPNSHSLMETRGHDERGQPRPREIPLPHHARELGKLVQQLDGTLKLTKEQREKISKIVAEGQEQNHKIWTNVAPLMGKVMQDVHQQIREQLTPEQRVKFEELMKQRPMRRPSPTNALQKLPAATNVPPPAPTNAPPGV